MATTLTVYDQNVICRDNTTGDNAVHYNEWKPFVYSECPNHDPNHTFETSLVLATVSNSVVSMVSDAQDTGGRYQNQQFNMDVPAGPSTDYPVASTKVFPYNVRISSYEMIPTNDNIGDSFSLYVLPPGPVGVLVSDVSSGKIINMSNSAITNVGLGMEIILDDGVTTQNLGECLSIDYTTQTITVENDVTNAFAAGTMVIFRSIIAKHIEVLSTTSIKFGTSMPGNKLIRKGFIIELCYNNATAVQKLARFRAEILV